MRQLHRRGMVLPTLSRELRVRIERPCDSCGAGCARELPDLSFVGTAKIAAGAQVQISLSARSLNLNCLSLFGPWLLVVAGLIALDLASADLAVSAAVALFGGAVALWVGRSLALTRSPGLSVEVVTEDARPLRDTRITSQTILN